MTCPFCQAEITAAAPARCPECGCEVMRLTSGLVKTSAVLIASKDTRQVFRSVQEVPEPLRRRLVESTQGINSATIVIADHGGREHMERQLDRRTDRMAAPADEAGPVAQAVADETAASEPAALDEQNTAAATPRMAWPKLIGIALAAATLAAGAAWALHGVQW